MWRQMNCGYWQQYWNDYAGARRCGPVNNMNFRGKEVSVARIRGERNTRPDRKNFHPLSAPEGNRFFYVSAICHVNSIVTWLHALANYNRTRRRRSPKLDVVLIDLDQSYDTHIDIDPTVPDGLWDEPRPLCGRPRIRNEIRN